MSQMWIWIFTLCLTLAVEARSDLPEDSNKIPSEKCFKACPVPEYCDESIGKCRSCAHVCKSPVDESGNCEALCPGYWKEVVTTPGVTCNITIVVSEEHSSLLLVQALLFTAILISIVLVAVRRRCCRKSVSKRLPPSSMLRPQQYYRHPTVIDSEYTDDVELGRSEKPEGVSGGSSRDSGNHSMSSEENLPPKVPVPQAAVIQNETPDSKPWDISTSRSRWTLDLPRLPSQGTPEPGSDQTEPKEHSNKSIGGTPINGLRQGALENRPIFPNGPPRQATSGGSSHSSLGGAHEVCQPEGEQSLVHQDKPVLPSTGEANCDQRGQPSLTSRQPGLFDSYSIPGSIKDWLDAPRHECVHGYGVAADRHLEIFISQEEADRVDKSFQEFLGTQRNAPYRMIRMQGPPEITLLGYEDPSVRCTHHSWINVKDKSEKSITGSLGTFLRVAGHPREVYAFCSAHLMEKGHSAEIQRPGSDEWEAMGEVTYREYAVDPNPRDFALIKLNEVFVQRYGLDLRYVKTIPVGEDPSYLQHGQKVYKVGSTSGKTTGTIIEYVIRSTPSGQPEGHMDSASPQSGSGGPRTKRIKYSPKAFHIVGDHDREGNRDFAREGDSGSLILSVTGDVALGYVVAKDRDYVTAYRMDEALKFASENFFKGKHLELIDLKSQLLRVWEDAGSLDCVDSGLSTFNIQEASCSHPSWA